MRILFVTPQPPSPTGGGAAIRNWHLIQAAKRAGHRVELVTFGGGLSAGAHFFRSVMHIPERTRLRRARDLITSRTPDLALRLDAPHLSAMILDAFVDAANEGEPFAMVQVEGLEMWANVAPVARVHRVATIYDAHNAEATLQGRTALHALRRRDVIGAGYSAVQWAKLRAYERRVVRTATATLTLSAEDAHALAALSGRAVEIVPVGVDTAFFAPDAPGLPAPIPFDVVFSGTLDYRPNADAARWLVEEIWPHVRVYHAGATLAIVGRNPLPELCAHHGRNGVTITGPVPDDRPYMAGAGVYALPIRFGAGVRLKLLNAMSMGCAVVTTPAGTEGVDVQNGRDLLLAPPAASRFAAALAAMLASPDYHARYGAAARRLMVTQHDWLQVTPALLRVYDRIERGNG